MAVITDPEVLKVVGKWRDKENHRLFNKIIDTTYPTNWQFQDLSGNDYGYIHVDKYCGRDKNDNKFFYCTCNYCGFKTIMSSNSLKRDGIKTCGCFKYKHNGAYERLYHEYQCVYDRCYNPNNRAYNKYGARGIKIADVWLGPDGYPNFKRWAYSNGYSEEYEHDKSLYFSLDREDNSLGYSPENCRIADMKLQSNNRSTTRFLWYKDYVFPIGIWCEIVDISRSTFLHRLERGWSLENALLTPTNTQCGENKIELIVPDNYQIYNKYEEFKNKGILETCIYP